MPLQERLRAVKKVFSARAPAPTVKAVLRSIEELLESGQGARALRAGDIAPMFNLMDTEGRKFSSELALRMGPLVVAFYRGIWCPYCNAELKALQEAHAALRERGAHMVALSPQTMQNSRKSQRKAGMTFPVLMDPGGVVAAAYGLRWTTPEYLRDIHRKANADLTLVNGENSWALPMPARYVIAQDGIIQYAEINPDFTKRPEPSEMFPYLDLLKRTAGEPHE